MLHRPAAEQDRATCQARGTRHFVPVVQRLSAVARQVNRERLAADGLTQLVRLEQLRTVQWIGHEELDATARIQPVLASDQRVVGIVDVVPAPPVRASRNGHVAEHLVLNGKSPFPVVRPLAVVSGNPAVDDRPEVPVRPAGDAAVRQELRFLRDIIPIAIDPVERRIRRGTRGRVLAHDLRAPRLAIQTNVGLDGGSAISKEIVGRRKSRRRQAVPIHRHLVFGEETRGHETSCVGDSYRRWST